MGFSFLTLIDDFVVVVELCIGLHHQGFRNNLVSTSFDKPINPVFSYQHMLDYVSHFAPTV